jgi:hypothetical protein
MAKLSNHPSGHKALIAHLLRGGECGLPEAGEEAYRIKSVFPMDN